MLNLSTPSSIPLRDTCLIWVEDRHEPRRISKSQTTWVAASPDSESGMSESFMRNITTTAC
jgi:hypothetical protein